MGDLRAFNLQNYVENYNCAYFVAAGSTENSLDHAVHYSFMRVWSLDTNLEFINKMRERYKFNPRVGLFERTHDAAFYELVRMVPFEYNAVVWISHNSDDIEKLAQVRPAKKDVVIINNSICSKLSDFVYINKFFGTTHHIETASLGASGNGIILFPNKLLTHE